MEIIDRLEEARKKLGLSQQKFSEKIGIAQNSYCMIENGKTTLSERNIKLICMVFEINENWLRSGEGEMFEKSIEIKNSEEKELIRMFRKLTAETKRVILEIVKKFAAVDEIEAQSETLENNEKRA